jgi:stringent starvation protein B
MREWMLDNGLTPHIIVDATAGGVVVARGAIRDGNIVLNISESAVTGLRLGNDAVEFCARFGGAAFDVYVPVDALIGVYARESGHGLLFAEGDEQPPTDPDSQGAEPAGPKPGKPSLKIVR